MKSWKKLTLVGTGSAVVALSIGAGITIPLLLKTKNALDQFIPDNHGWKNKVSKSKTSGLNYVALGDSESSGFNGYMGEDYLSFADFLANDMKKANVLDTYKNFSVAGALISGTHDMINRTPSVMENLGTADVITVTIGANDLLSYVRILDAQFGLSIGQLIGLAPIQSNPNRDVSNPDDTSSTGDPISANERWGLLNNSISEGAKMFANNDFSGIISLQPKLVDTVYKLIKRDMVTLLADIGKVAPNANVIVLAHAFPFVNFPDSVINGEVPSNNMTFKEGYERFIEALKSATSYAEFAKFQAIDDIPNYKNDNSVRPNADGSESPTDTNEWMHRYRKMPNLADIHPSTYGHSLIGNGLFSLASQWKLTETQNPSDFYTSVTAPTDPKNMINENGKLQVDPKAHPENFEAYDESQYASTSMDVIARSLLRQNKTRNLFSEIFNVLDPNNTKSAPNPNDPTNSKNTSAFNVTFENGTLASAATGPVAKPDNQMSQLIEALFGITIDPSQPLDIMSLIPLLGQVAKDPNFAQMFTSLGVLLTSAIQQGDSKGNGVISPLDYMKQVITSYKQAKTFTTAQMTKINTEIGAAITKRKTDIGGGNVLISYNDDLSTFGISSISTDYGVNNFGELMEKYTATSTLALLGVVPMLLPQFNVSIAEGVASNNGQDFLNRINSMGASNVSDSFKKGIDETNNYINDAANASDVSATNTKLKNDATTLLNYIDSLNTNFNQAFNTNPTDSTNDIWNILASGTSAEVRTTIQDFATKLSEKDQALWQKVSNGQNAADFMRTLTPLLDEFSAVQIFSKDAFSANVANTIQTAVFQYYVTKLATSSNNPITLIGGSFVQLLQLFN